MTTTGTQLCSCSFLFLAIYMAQSGCAFTCHVKCFTSSLGFQLSCLCSCCRKFDKRDETVVYFYVISNSNRSKNLETPKKGRVSTRVLICSRVGIGRHNNAFISLISNCFGFKCVLVLDYKPKSEVFHQDCRFPGGGGGGVEILKSKVKKKS